LYGPAFRRAVSSRETGTMHIHTIALIGMSALSLSGIAWNLQNQPANYRELQIETVSITAGTMDYRPSGEYLVGGKPASAAIREADFVLFEIMKYQVGSADYRNCVADGACNPLDRKTPISDGIPATGINYFDAKAYAAWLSYKTGETWRLPTDAEWSYAAADKYGSNIFTGEDDPDNPAVAWIRRYREQAELRRNPEPKPMPAAHYGVNRFGLADVAGNVWEWTSDCDVRVTVDPVTGEALQGIENCGVHVLGGQHRTYMSDFIRDRQSGGCAVGLPPDHLGFRLVREPSSELRRLDRILCRKFRGLV
jgi:formylglycine-generating enzyme required for sulfatase activity